MNQDRIDYTRKKWTKREQEEYLARFPQMRCANCGYRFPALKLSKSCPLCGNEYGNVHLDGEE